MSHKVIVPIGGQDLIIETGHYTKQADGAVTVQLGETVILTAAVAASKAKPGQEFFPLTVDYRERAAAAGRFPGGYFKREGRPSEKEILTCRLTDRPIRPLFPKGWYNEVQVQSILMSADGQNDSDILSILAASAALMVSDIPWAGPLGAARIGRVEGKFVVNPTHEQQAASDLDLIYVGNKHDVVMYEGSANEITDVDFIAALRFAQEAIQPLITAQEELAQKVGKTKRTITTNVVPEEILKDAKKIAGDRIVTALLTPGKLAREGACNTLFAEIGTKLTEKYGADKVSDFVIKDAQYYIQKEAVRSLILDQGKRLDGRTYEQIRPLHSEVSILPRAHGSSLFQRGETQAVCLATLGTGDDIQEFDSYTGGETKKQFILHYNFPNFSVGETGRITGPGRREIGHGALAERSVRPVIPLKEYPYAVRVVSEILESNGSSSMASVCGATLALMDAGVPLIRPVAGISIGICTDYDDNDQISRYKLLTDIIGWEDAFCDMDCKIAGTEKGITGFQLDLKLKGLPLAIMEQTVQQAFTARLEILRHMFATLPAPRTEISKYAPRIITLKINPEKIGMLIGPGGKNIKRLVDESGCEINIEDDGTVKIFSVTPEGMEIARREIEGMSAEIEINKIYKGRVVTIKEFGAFVEVFPGQDGLVHISELSDKRVARVEDVVKMGDEITVKCIGVDEKGRVKLSRKAALADRGEAAAASVDQVGAAPREEVRPERSERPERRERPERSDRGERPVRSADRPERPERSDRPERAVRERSERPVERVERVERPVRSEAPERAERVERTERPERVDRPVDRPERPERSERPDRGERVAERTPDRGGDRYERSPERTPERTPDRGDRPERSERTDRGDRPERTERSDRGERAPERTPERAPERSVDRGDRSERAPLRSERAPERGERTERIVDRGDRDDRGDRVEPSRRFADRGDRAEVVEPVRADRFERDDRSDDGDRSVRSERPERSDRGDRSSSSRGPRRSESGGDSSRGDNSDLEVGTIYRAKVVTIKDFGAFVEFMPGREGLVHVSELANARVKRVEDVVQVGDEISVKLIGVDDKGRVRLSRRAAIEERDRALGGNSTREPRESSSFDDSPRD